MASLFVHFSRSDDMPQIFHRDDGFWMHHIHFTHKSDSFPLQKTHTLGTGTFQSFLSCHGD